MSISLSERAVDSMEEGAGSCQGQSSGGRRGKGKLVESVLLKCLVMDPVLGWGKTDTGQRR